MVTVVDYVLFRGGPTAGPVPSSAIFPAETLALLPVLLCESITLTSIAPGHSSVNALGSIFPGSDEARLSLASFVTFVRLEWCVEGAALSAERYGITGVTIALFNLGALQAS
jgi:sn1-specific diacylglycerol lipase